MKDLSKRQKTLLRCIVNRFVETAMPVGSKQVVQSTRLGLSAATVRNEMMILEERGFLFQPHTSAGRVPTEEAYRYFVDHLQAQVLPEEARTEIRKRFERVEGDIRSILQEASSIIGTISRELGVVLTPWISHWIFDRIELIPLTLPSVLAVIVVRERQAKRVILRIESTLNEKDLKKTEAVINERLSGLTIHEIRETLRERLRDAAYAHEGVVQAVVSSAEELFDFNDPVDIHTSGTEFMLKQPEFEDRSMVGAILSLVEDRLDLLEDFQEPLPKPVVSIGKENRSEKLRTFSVIKAGYRIGCDQGTLGVVGPTRMPYGRIVSLVGFMASEMSRQLSS